MNNTPKQGWGWVWAGIRVLGEDVPARRRLCSLQSSESDPDSPPFPKPGFSSPRYGDSPWNCLQDMWGACAGPGRDSSGHRVGFAHSFGLQPLFLPSFGHLCGTSCRGPAEPTQPRPVNPRCEGEGIKRDRTGKTARRRLGLLQLLQICPSPASDRTGQPAAPGEAAAGAGIAFPRAGSWERAIVRG